MTTSRTKHASLLAAALAATLIACDGTYVPADAGCPDATTLALPDAATASVAAGLHLEASTLGRGWSVGDGDSLRFDSPGCDVPTGLAIVPVPADAHGSELHVRMSSSLPFNVLEAQYFTAYAIGTRSRIELRIVDFVQPYATVSVRIPYGHILTVGFNVQTLNCVTHVQPSHVTIYGAWLAGTSDDR